MSKARLYIRLCIIALGATFVLSLALSFFKAELLPEGLRAWEQESRSDSALVALLGLAFSLVGMGAYAVSLVGLFFFQRWAAMLLLVMTTALSLVFLFEPSVEPGISAFVGNWDGILTGAVLALAFCTDALDAGQG